MVNTKQYIILRKDLKMNKGKIAAQASHASVNAYIQCLNDEPHQEILDNWFNTGYTKIALSVSSEEELNNVFKKAISYKLHTSYIIDEGRTCFDGKETPTCIGIGPEKTEILNKLFSDLKLF